MALCANLPERPALGRCMTIALLSISHRRLREVTNVSSILSKGKGSVPCSSRSRSPPPPPAVHRGRGHLCCSAVLQSCYPLSRGLGLLFLDPRGAMTDLYIVGVRPRLKRKVSLRAGGILARLGWCGVVTDVSGSCAVSIGAMSYCWNDNEDVACL
jgi:hypothetical protein